MYKRIFLNTLISIFIFTLGHSADNKDSNVTIHAEDAPLSSVLAMLAQESEYNIVTGPNVNNQDKLTIHLTEVPINQAIDLVVRASGLSYEIVGSSILVAAHSNISKDVGITPHVVSLQYANPADVAKLLQFEDPNDLNNYIKKLKDKGALTFNKGSYEVNKMLNPQIKKIEINIV